MQTGEDSSDGEFDERRLGAHIRELRLDSRKSLRTLAADADVSVSFLSQVERGTASPSIASLMRIAKALDQTIGSLFESRTENWLVRAGQGARLVHPNREWDEELLSPREFTKLQVIRSTLAAGGSTGAEPLSYGPAETTMVVQEGAVDVTIGADTYHLGVGDAISFDPHTPHTIANVGDAACGILFASSAPAY